MRYNLLFSLIKFQSYIYGTEASLVEGVLFVLTRLYTVQFLPLYYTWRVKELVFQCNKMKRAEIVLLIFDELAFYKQQNRKIM